MSVRRLVTATATALTLLATAFAAVPASAASLDSATSQKEAAQDKWYTSGSGRCLDASLSQGVTLKRCNSGSVYQDWTYPASNYRLLHKQSLRCLDGSRTQGVKLAVCDPNSRHQMWNYLGEYHVFENLAGGCLDGSISQGLRILDCNINSDYQLWFRTAAD